MCIVLCGLLLEVRFLIEVLKEQSMKALYYIFMALLCCVVIGRATYSFNKNLKILNTGIYSVLQDTVMLIIKVYRPEKIAD